MLDSIFTAVYPADFDHLLTIFSVNLFTLGANMKEMQAAAGHASMKALAHNQRKFGCSPKLIQVIQRVISRDSTNDINSENTMRCFIIFLR